MSIRTKIAGVALAGALTLAGGGTAFAQTDPASSPPFPNHPNVTCEEAVHWAATFQARLDQVKARVADMKVRRDRLVAEGHYERARLLTERIQFVEGRIATAQEKLTNLEQHIRDRCGPNADGGESGQDSQANT
jgi:hypothetical protein